MEWSLGVHNAVADWMFDLDEDSFLQVRAAINVLRRRGPHLGRPLVDTVVRSRHKNMKELRPGSSGDSELRILFAFDPGRRAMLLITGDKNGQWDAWYRTAIPLADDRFDEHLEQLREKSRRKKSNDTHA